MADTTIPQSVEDIFDDYKKRRSAIIRALTTDSPVLFKACESEGPDLGLYGLPSGDWEVKPRSSTIPPPLPEPTFGVNKLNKKDRDEWLNRLAMYSDAWLSSVATFDAANLPQTQRMDLFIKMGECRSLQHAIDNRVDIPAGLGVGTKREVSGGSNNSSDEPCGSCGRASGDDFWIMCDDCEVWFHGDCVGVTSEMAKSMDAYHCSKCNNTREASGGSSNSSDEPCGVCGRASGDEFWIMCDDCNVWFHVECVGETPLSAESMGPNIPYHCGKCNKPDVSDA